MCRLDSTCDCSSGTTPSSRCGRGCLLWWPSSKAEWGRSKKSTATSPWCSQRRTRPCRYGGQARSPPSLLPSYPPFHRPSLPPWLPPPLPPTPPASLPPSFISLFMPCLHPCLLSVQVYLSLGLVSISVTGCVLASYLLFIYLSLCSRPPPSLLALHTPLPLLESRTVLGCSAGAADRVGCFGCSAGNLCRSVSVSCVFADFCILCLCLLTLPLAFHAQPLHH